ncbi:hypothetical protein ACIBF3_13780, partial [Bacillus mobilis]|uniref:hypothetical protein n=1 Tax=Bacillus mobilis TaxID=2026190 RepID=UPI003644E119
QTKNTSIEFAYLVCEFRRCFFHVPLFGFTSDGKGFLFYPALMGSKTPLQNSVKAKKLGGGRAAH